MQQQIGKCAREVRKKAYFSIAPVGDKSAESAINKARHLSAIKMQKKEKKFPTEWNFSLDCSCAN